MRRSRRVSCVLVLMLVLAACSSGHPASNGTAGSAAASSTSTPARDTRSAGCRARQPFHTGASDHSLRSGGVERVYELDIPSDYDGTKPFAVVFGLHALTVNYKFIPSMVGFDLGARDHFIGVSPSGLLANGTPYWNAAPVADNDDVAFIGKLLDQLEATLCINPSRVYSTGMSNGAQMSSLLACRLSKRIAGIAPVSGEEYLSPCDGRPVPIIAFHGTADPILPYKGGGLNATHIASLYYYRGHLPPGLPAPLGIDESMRRWAQHNGCASRPVETRVAPHILHRVWQHCAAATELYIEEGAGHNWPGKPMAAFEKEFGPGTTEIDATKLIFHFFFDDGS